MIIRPPARTHVQAPDTGRRAPGIDAAGISLLVAIAFVTRFFFLYRNGMGEPDSMVMASGMASMLSPGIRFSDCFLYGKELNPGFYFLFKTVYPMLFDDPRHIISFLNWIGLISATLAVWPGYIILRNRFGPLVSAGCISLIIFSPIVWELGTYFHPVTPAFLLFLCAWICWRRISSSFSGIIWFILASFLAAAAVITRTEIVMIVPALFTAILLGKNRKKELPALIIILLIAAASYLLLLRSIPGQVRAADSGAGGYITSFIDMYRSTLSPSGIPRTAVWAALGIGTGSIFIAFSGLLIKTGKKTDKIWGRDRKMLIPALVWIFPSLILWLLWPVPVIRHYFLIIPAICWIAAETLLKRISEKKSAVIVIAAVLCTLILPEILYRVYNRANPEGTKEPHGAFFYYHARVEKRIQRYGGMRSALFEYIDKGSSDPSAGRSKHILVPVTWESYGYLVHAIAGTMRLEKKQENVEREDLFLHRYYIDDLEILVADARGFSFDSVPDRLQDLLAEKAGKGYSILLPAETVRSEPASSLPAEAVITY